MVGSEIKIINPIVATTALCTIMPNLSRLNRNLLLFIYSFSLYIDMENSTKIWLIGARVVLMTDFLLINTAKLQSACHDWFTSLYD
jgi:hypothetical protein